MSDIIARLRLDSSAYDQKIKRAAQNLLEFEQECRATGQSMNSLSKENLDYVRGLGQMQTKMSNARGQLNELTQAFTELSLQYKRLSDEEKNGDIGKALSSSLDQLKGRITELKSNLGDVSKELGDTAKESQGAGSALDALTSKFGMNIKQLAGWGAAIGAAKAALGVAKDAFFASEANVDEWGRVVASAQSVYESFLTALNNGDISGFLTRIDEIVVAARKAYDELDRLGTMKTIQSPQIDRQMSEITRMRTMLMTGRYIAPAAGTGLKATMAEGSLLSPAQIKSIEQHLQNALTTIVKLNENELTQTGRAIDAYYNKLAVQNGMTMAEFRKGVSSMAEFDTRVEGAKAYEIFEARRKSVQSLANSGQNLTAEQAALLTAKNPNESFKGWSTFRVDKMGENSYNDLVGLIKQQQQQQQQLYSMMGQAYRTINRAEGITVKGLMGGVKGGGSSDKLIEGGVKGLQDMTDETHGVTESMKELQAALAYFKQQLSSATSAEQSTAAKSAITRVQRAIESQPTALEHGIDVTTMVSIEDNARESMQQAINEWAPLVVKAKTEWDAENLQETAKGGNDIAAAMNVATQAVSSLGSALHGIENPTAKIIAIVAEAIANVAMAAGKAVAAQDTTESGYAWIGAAAAITAQMVTMITSIHSMTGYSEGGVIKGNSYSGDHILGVVDGGTPVGLNAGEIVLNRALAGNIASQLQDSGAGGATDIRLSGEDMIITINNTLRRMGKTKFLLADL